MVSVPTPATSPSCAVSTALALALRRRHVHPPGRWVHRPCAQLHRHHPRPRPTASWWRSKPWRWVHMTTPSPATSCCGGRQMPTTVMASRPPCLWPADPSLRRPRGSPRARTTCSLCRPPTPWARARSVPCVLPSRRWASLRWRPLHRGTSAGPRSPCSWSGMNARSATTTQS